MTQTAQTMPDNHLATFGLPLFIPREAAESVQGKLIELWQACHHREPAGLRPDLELHHRYFDPVAQGKRLRTALLEIDPVPVPSSMAPAQFLEVDDERNLITPEGRVALEVVSRGLEAPERELQLDEALAERREQELLTLYREWGRHRLYSVVDLLGGGRKPLQNPAIGGVLTLMVNRSDSPERAIKRYPPGTARDVIDDVFRSCAHAFAQEIAPSRRRSETKERLISGWTLGEVKRRMPDALESSDKTGVYVRKSRIGDLIGLIVSELQKRKYDSGRVEDSFDSLVREFRRRAQDLAGYGLLFERPTDTSRLREALFEVWAATS